MSCHFCCCSAVTSFDDFACHHLKMALKLTGGLFVALLFLACVGLAKAAPSRERRSLWQLNTVISCYTGHSGLLMMNGYGCWCGLGGAGQPVDETDRCCQGHDLCYQILQDNHCGVYFPSYAYTSQNCDTGHGRITCTSDSGCERALCECDRRLAECLRANENTYHEAFANFEKRFCEGRLDADPGLTHQVIASNSSITMVVGREADAYHVNQVPEQVGVGGAGAGNHIDAGPN